MSMFVNWESVALRLFGNSVLPAVCQCVGSVRQIFRGDKPLPAVKPRIV